MPGTSGFIPWGPDHQAVLALLAVGAAALLWAGRRISPSADRRLRRGLAVLLVSNEAIAYAASLAHGVVRVPLQLCDLAFFVTVWALVSARPVEPHGHSPWHLPERPWGGILSEPTAGLSRAKSREGCGASRRLVAEVAYFWGLAGSLQAVLTPDVQEAFPDYWWMKFFVSHCGVVLGAVYLGSSGRIRPTHRSVWKLFALTNGYAVIAGMINWLFGTNYGYLARKPMQPSLLDAFGPWPYYILGMELMALLSFYLYYAPFALARRAQR